MPKLSLLLLLLLPLGASARQNFDPPPPFPPDAAAQKQIEAKTAELRTAVEALKIPQVRADVKADVAIYLKAAEWIVRHNEFFQKDSDKQTLRVLDAGLARAKSAREGKTPWREIRGKSVARGYYSTVDDSLQPFAVTLPEGFGTENKKWRTDVVLHGREATLTEVKFLNARENAKAGKGSDRVVIDIYGRGNNAYRWAGETDVMEAVQWFATKSSDSSTAAFDEARVVMRGFSMGGAGAWHLGLHHPFGFAAVGPGAGFTTTHGYIKNLAKALPEYQERTLHIYDAVDYAENAFNVPIVAYSGEKDPQKAAADNIEAKLKAFDKPVRFTHLVAPGLEHQMPAEWQAKADAEFQKHLAGGRTWPETVHFVTYTTRYHDFGHGFIEALDRHYDRAVIDSTWTNGSLKLTTTNVRAIRLLPEHHPLPAVIAIDGQEMKCDSAGKKPGFFYLTKTNGKWAGSTQIELSGLQKKATPIQTLQGPIDDAFQNKFEVVRPTGKGWSPAVEQYTIAALDRFAGEWDKYFRGKLPEAKPGRDRPIGNLVLFGDPGSNPDIARVVAKLPIVWTPNKLVVNGVSYDPKTHVPLLIYPNPLNPTYYVVINSGHTFHAEDLKGTNALLYPRLGDWAVLKPTPTAKDPTAAEVVAAGLFDEQWQFQK